MFFHSYSFVVRFLSICSLQLHRAREVPEDGDAALLLGGRHARQEPRRARLDGAHAHQGPQVLQRLQEEGRGRHGNLLRRSVGDAIAREREPWLEPYQLLSYLAYGGQS